MKFVAAKIFLWALISAVCLFTSCVVQNEKPTFENPIDLVMSVPDTMVNKSIMVYDPERSMWTLAGLPYSGYAVAYYPDQSLKELFGVLDGKKQNKYVQWFPDGHLKHVADYHLGKLHGKKKLWTQDSNHVLIAHFSYYQGKPHGEQKKWYPTGELSTVLNLNMGKEEGLQQAFRQNGVLYANYEARGGRIFGLKNTSLCYGLEEEQMPIPED
ncbi:MAG: membrane-binding protein [Cytophagales bacterium]|nr:membrane-binding protein [Cytophagales bacterium]